MLDLDHFDALTDFTDLQQGWRLSHTPNYMRTDGPGQNMEKSKICRLAKQGMYTFHFTFCALAERYNTDMYKHHFKPVVNMQLPYV